MQFDFRKTGVKGLVNFSTFGCNVFAEDPPTPDRLPPDIFYSFITHSDAKVTAPDGRQIRFWGFSDVLSDDPARSNNYPSPLIRLRQGQVIHVRLESEHGPHTIHYHAIEPTTMNDGVGHVSFEVNDVYTYQWQAAEVGTFFYHCHRNTVLHFEMGMVGPLIVDPPEGPGFVHTGGPRYHVERAWLVDDVDPRWHSQNAGEHDQGLCGEDVGFNRFEPKYFLINGVFSNRTMHDPRVMAEARLGQRVLIRIINASYSVLRITLGHPATLVEADGRILGLAARPWSRRVAVSANNTQILTTSGRFSYLFAPTVRGSIPIRIEFLDWIKGTVQDNGRGVITSQIRVV